VTNNSDELVSYDKALEINPKNSDAWYFRGNTLGQLKRYEEAIQSYDKALEINPKNSDAWYFRGNTLGQLKCYEEAIQSYDKALEINPKNSDAWYFRGNALGQLKRYEEAIQSYDKALEINPKNSDAWYFRGNTLAQLKRYEETILISDNKTASNYSKKIKLIVDSAYPGDQGGGKARLDPETVLALNISYGDLIKISGKRETIVKVWRSLAEDWNKKKVRIDAFTRKNSKTNFGELVEITPISDIEAKKVVFSSTKKGKIIELSNHATIINSLIDFPIQNHDIVPVFTNYPLGTPQLKEIKITNVFPKNSNIITKDTEITFDNYIKFLETKKFDKQKVNSISWLEISKLNIDNSKLEIPLVLKYFYENKFNKPLKEIDYDVVLSFAGEDRDYVKKVATFLKKNKIKVFYDDFETVDLWGKDLADHLQKVYGGSAKYCVMFISKFYAQKTWPNHERKSAVSKAIKEKGEYILPAKFDDTEIPGLPDTIGYLDLRKIEPEQLGGMIIQKLAK
jgi:hypothetical protein